MLNFQKTSKISNKHLQFFLTHFTVVLLVHERIYNLTFNFAIQVIFTNNKLKNRVLVDQICLLHYYIVNQESAACG